MEEENFVDWDYWPWIWLVFLNGEVAIKDFNGWYLFSGQKTLGM